MRVITILAFSVLIISCSSSRQFYIVRHAEKESVNGSSGMMANDPPLSARGRVRAIELREELKDKNIRHIYSTDLIRTRTTAQPLAEMRGLPVQYYQSRASLDSLVERWNMLTRGNVLIVGHSNTVDDLVAALTGQRHFDDLKDHEYDNLYIVTRKGKKRSFERRKYGTLTP